MKKSITLLFSLFCFLAAMAQPTDSCTVVTATLETQSWGYEIGFDISDQNGDLIFSHLPQTAQANETMVYTLCLAPGCYVIDMYDTFGDGWNGGTLTLAGGEDGESHLYTLNTGDQGFGFYSPQIGGCFEVEIDYGCTDSLAINYDPVAIFDDGSCEYPSYGCTDPAAINFNPWANVDDGSCIYPVQCDSNQTLTNLYVCVFSNGANVGFEIVSELGDTVYSMYGFNNNAIENFDLCLDQGVCYTATMYNLGGETGWYNGYWWANVNGVQVINETLNFDLSVESVVFSVDGTCGEVFGCTDPEAANYNPDATSDDGSCYYPIDNDLCADATPITPGVYAVNNNGAYLNENIYGDCWNSGGGEGEQTSVWYSFTTPDGPAHIVLEAYGDGSYTFTDTQFGIFEECGGEMIHCDGNGGDGLFSRLDFDCGVLDENTTYLLVIDGWYGDSGTCFLSYTSSDVCGDPVLGCTDPIALNYNPAATMDDGSCVYLPDSCEQNLLTFELNTVSWGSEISFSVEDDNGDTVLDVTGFENNSTYFFAACVQAGCYTISLEDSFGDGWNGGELSVSLDGNVIVSGITLPTGTEGTATFGVYTDDCDPSWDIFGCTDPAANNYNPLATIDDGSCFYQDSLGCDASFEIITVDYDSNMVWIVNTSMGNNIGYVWDFGDGTISTDPFPTHTYEEEGTYLICLVAWNESCETIYCDTVSYFFPPVQPGSSSTGNWFINVVPPSVTALSESDFDAVPMNVYPNPAVNELTLTIEVDELDGLRYQMLDITGRLLLDRPMRSTTERIDVGAMSNGVYLLQLIGENGSQTRRVEIQH